MNFRWSKRDRDHLISAYRNGCSIEALADHYDRSERSIRVALSAWGACDRMKRRLTEEERVAIMKMIEAGVPDEDIGRKFDRHRSRIASIRKRMGVGRPMGRRKR